MMTRMPLAVAIYFAISSAAFAQTDTQTTGQQAPAPADKTATLPTVTVTAQKRTENLQKVPISIQVLSSTKLKQQNVTDFDSYAKLLPSVSYQTAGPGFAQVYMRGVSSGGDGNHSGPLPSVGVYLDEQPVTTIQGALDLHIYDIQRIESLAGPQGTLYGASSQAGTLRIITNKPDPSGFAAGYSAEINATSGGGMGHIVEGFVNEPISSNAAIRLVGWSEHDGGYIDNVPGTRTFPSWFAATHPGDDAGATTQAVASDGAGTINNFNTAKNNYNDTDTYGFRAALKVDLNDNWTITPTVMGQDQRTNGFFAFDPAVGDLKVTHFYPEKSKDRFIQSALTVQGKIGNFDVTYAYANLGRHDKVDSDYNDYGFWYDTVYGLGSAFYDNNGDLINPSQYIQGKDGYRKISHELRIASPKEDRFRFVAGVFSQRQSHDIEQRYKVDGLADVLSITGWPDTIWLTKQIRKDNDDAIFGELSYDITDKLTATGGMRFFRADNSLKGFFGFSQGYYPGADYGEAACISQTNFHGAPCLVFDKQVKENKHISKFNLTYKINDTKMIYGTWSEGYRPGGINRRGTLPPYLSDFLTNYEFGWKTTWLDNRFSFNGSVFRETWKDFQFAILGANGLTEIKNANQAEIKGVEVEGNWAATYNLNLSGGFAYYDAKLTANYCGLTDANGTPITDCASPEAPNGAQLPVTPKFKSDVTARYTFDLGSYEAYWQASFFHVGKRKTDLRTFEDGVLGDMPAYNLTDLSVGIKKNSWSLDFYVKNAFDQRGQISRFTTCAEAVCGNAAGGTVFPVPPQYANGQVYITPVEPRVFGVRFSQDF
jgi:outer membrane receptor protein involved in Fe transport